MKKKILLIDDDKDFGVLLRGFFSKEKFQVLLAYTLGEGMAVMERERPEYIFLDNNLPDGTGWDKASFIQLQYPMAHLNLISAWVPEKPMGDLRILQKPIRINDLMACMQ